MHIYVMTLFPEMVESTLHTSITGRAIDDGSLELTCVNIRDFSNDKHGRVDDYPFGGGAGMVMEAQPVYDCYKHIREQIGHDCPVIAMSPKGRTFNQGIAKELSKETEFILLCGHYEGIDQRVLDEIVTDYISIGDFVLTGGELAACVITDCIARLIPGVLETRSRLRQRALKMTYLSIRSIRGRRSGMEGRFRRFCFQEITGW